MHVSKVPHLGTVLYSFTSGEVAIIKVKASLKMYYKQTRGNCQGIAMTKNL